MLDDSALFTVTDLKQFTYCARVVFYERCLPHIRPRTYKMDAGRDAHEEEHQRAVRRTLNQYDLPDGQRYFNVQLTSTVLGLTGELDEVVETADGQVFPVDYKLAKYVSGHHRLQLAAYAMLLEEYRQCDVPQGFIYLIPTRQTTRVEILGKLREQVTECIAQLNHMVTSESMPPATTKPQLCAACEFRRFCNDI